MYRSASTSRFPDRYNDHNDHHYSYYSSSSALSSKVSSALRALSLEANELPVYQQSANKKAERSRTKFAENAVHLIPLILLLCALILWLFSNPNVDLRGKSSVANADIREMMIQREMDSDGSGHVIPVNFGDIDKKAKMRDSQSILVIK